MIHGPTTIKIDIHGPWGESPLAHKYLSVACTLKPLCKASKTPIVAFYPHLNFKDKLIIHIENKICCSTKKECDFLDIIMWDF